MSGRAAPLVSSLSTTTNHDRAGATRQSGVGSSRAHKQQNHSALSASASASASSLLRHLSHRHHLYHPPPTSMTLRAALLLLDAPWTGTPDYTRMATATATTTTTATMPSNEGVAAAKTTTTTTGQQHVYLLPRRYLRDWIEWAYDQPAPPSERGRARLALRMAMELYDLDASPANGRIVDEQAGKSGGNGSARLGNNHASTEGSMSASRNRDKRSASSSADDPSPLLLPTPTPTPTPPQPPTHPNQRSPSPRASRPSSLPPPPPLHTTQRVAPPPPPTSSFPSSSCSSLPSMSRLHRPLPMVRSTSLTSDVHFTGSLFADKTKSRTLACGASDRGTYAGMMNDDDNDVDEGLREEEDEGADEDNLGHLDECGNDSNGPLSHSLSSSSFSSSSSSRLSKRPPGPIDATPLSLPGHPLLLRPNVVAGRGSDDGASGADPLFSSSSTASSNSGHVGIIGAGGNRNGGGPGNARRTRMTRDEVGTLTGNGGSGHGANNNKPPPGPPVSLSRRSRSFTGLEGYRSAVAASAYSPRAAAATAAATNDNDDVGETEWYNINPASISSTSDSVGCAPVPSAFYELLRSVHGVLCDDMRSVSFQPPGPSSSSKGAPLTRRVAGVIQHHEVVTAKDGSSGDDGDGGAGGGGSGDGGDGEHDEEKKDDAGMGGGRLAVANGRMVPNGPRVTATSSSLSSSSSSSSSSSPPSISSSSSSSISLSTTTVSGTANGLRGGYGEGGRAGAATMTPRPVEFRRTVLPVVPSFPSYRSYLYAADNSSRPTLSTSRTCVVEVHPVKMLYTVASLSSSSSSSSSTAAASFLPGSSDAAAPPQPALSSSTSLLSTDLRMERVPRPNGFVLASRSVPASEALRSLIKCAAPGASSACARLWGRHAAILRKDGRTGAVVDAGDGWELIDLAWMEKEEAAAVAAAAAAAAAGGGDGRRGRAWANDSSVITCVEGGIGHGPTIGTTAARMTKTLAEWIRSCRFVGSTPRSVHLLVEVRPTPTSPWPRSGLELASRLQVGDFVDAQDTAGKWYEAVVRDVHPRAVRVHYAGWNSRWDAWVPRRSEDGGDGRGNGGAVRGETRKAAAAASSFTESADEWAKGCSWNVSPPCPLWSKTGRWRDTIAIGDDVEVREASSLMQRPKWFRAMIRAVGREGDVTRELVDGAELEALEDDRRFGYEADGRTARRKRPLLLLNRTRQVLVEVPQEKFNTAGALDATAAGEARLRQRIPISPSFDGSVDGPGSLVGPATGVGVDEDVDDIPKPNPPYLRWVDLYGEEICKACTHNKPIAGGGGGGAGSAALGSDGGGGKEPATVQYAHHPSRERVEVLKSYNGMHGAGFVRESIRGVPPAPGSVGLQNLGNSCFLNSIVQCLNHIEPLTKYFLDGRFKKELNKDNPLGSGGRVAEAYAALLNDMWGGEFSTLAPRLLKQTVGYFAPQFNNVYQHDSQEFCSFLMDGLHEDLNRVLDKPYVEDLEARGMDDNDAAIVSWKKHLLRHDSIVVDHCQGLHRSHLTCPQCGRESVKFDVYATLSLPLVPVKDRSAIPLTDCLEQFTAGEQLDERNAWYCPSCEKHVCALKMMALWSTPDILILHLKRFSYDTCQKRGGLVRTKLEDTVNFPVDRLDLRRYVLGPVDPDAPPVYNLFGVSEHSGSTANSGHYTATVRNSRDGKWYRFNDSHVGVTSGDAAVTGGAYLLFYQRAGSRTSRWGGLERAMRLREEAHARGSHGMRGVGGGGTLAVETDEEGFTTVKSKKKKKGRSGTSPRK